MNWSAKYAWNRVVSEVRGVWGDGRGWVLVAVSVGWLVGLGVRLVFPAVLPHIRAEFGMNLSTAGTLLSALWIGYAVMQFPGGVLADRIGERTVLAASSGTALVGVAGVVAARGTVAFFAATVLVGLGVGLYGTTRLTVLGDVFPDCSGAAIGINQAAGNVGTTALPAIAGFLAVLVGWRWGFAVLLPAFLLVTIGLWSTVPTRTSARGETESSADRRAYVGRIVRHPQVVLSMLVLAAVSFFYQAFTGFYPTYLVASKGLDSEVAATLLGVFFASAIVIQPIAGVLRDRIGTRTTLVAVLLATGSVLATLPFVRGFASLVALTVLAGVMLANWPIANAYLVDLVPSEVRGSAVGLARTGYLLVGASGPIFVGVAGDAGRLDAAFLTLAGLAFLAAIPALWLAPTDRTTVGT